MGSIVTPKLPLTLLQSLSPKNHSPLKKAINPIYQEA
jgi:hypothetical protein